MKTGEKYMCIKSWKGEEELENIIVQGRSYKLKVFTEGGAWFDVEKGSTLFLPKKMVTEHFDMNPRPPILKVKDWVKTKLIEEIEKQIHRETLI